MVTRERRASRRRRRERRPKTQPKRQNQRLQSPREPVKRRQQDEQSALGVPPHEHVRHTHAEHEQVAHHDEKHDERRPVTEYGEEHRRQDDGEPHMSRIEPDLQRHEERRRIERYALTISARGLWVRWPTRRLFWRWNATSTALSVTDRAPRKVTRQIETKVMTSRERRRRRRRSILSMVPSSVS